MLRGKAIALSGKSTGSALGIEVTLFLTFETQPYRVGLLFRFPNNRADGVG